MIATVLLDDGHIGKIYTLTGPQSLTRVEQVAQISAGIGRDLDLVEISPEDFRADVSAFVPEGIISMLTTGLRRSPCPIGSCPGSRT